MSNKIKVPTVLDNLDEKKTHELYETVAELDKVKLLQKDIVKIVDAADLNALPTLIALSRSYRSALMKMIKEMQSIHKELMKQEDGDEEESPGTFFMFAVLMHGIHENHYAVNSVFHDVTKEIYEKTNSVFNQGMRLALTKEAELFMKRSTEIYNQWVPGFQAVDDSEEKNNDKV